jgi:hypothetical protein
VTYIKLCIMREFHHDCSTHACNVLWPYSPLYYSFTTSPSPLNKVLRCKWPQCLRILWHYEVYDRRICPSWVSMGRRARGSDDPWLCEIVFRLVRGLPHRGAQVGWGVWWIPGRREAVVVFAERAGVARVLNRTFRCYTSKCKLKEAESILHVPTTKKW